MPDTTYTISYSVDTSKAIRGIDQLEQRLLKLEATIAKAVGRLATLGRDTQGIAKIMAALVRLDAELQRKVVDADKASKALAGVGGGNRALAGYIERLGRLEAELKKVEAAAAAAAASSGQVGSGGPRAGGGGGGGSASAAPASRPGVPARKWGGVARRVAEKAAGAAAGAGIWGMARKVVAAGGDAAAEQREYFEEAGKQYAEFRESATEYASLRKVKGGANPQLIREAVAFGKENALPPEDLIPFLATYEGSAATGRDAGNLGGSVARGEITAEKQRELERRIQSVGAQFGGRVEGLPELGAWIGMASVVSKSPGSSGTTYGQVSRLLNEVGGDEAAFLKKAGVADKKGDFAKLKALRDHLEKVKPADANAYLEAEGSFGNSTDRRSVLGMIGMVDVLEGRIAEANRRAANGQETIDANAEFMRGHTATARTIETTDFGGEIETGIIANDLVEGRDSATARMKNPNQPGGQRFKAGGIMGVLDVAGSAMSMGARSGEQIRVDAEAINHLLEGGRKVGLDLEKKYPELAGQRSPMAWNALGEQKFAEQFSRASEDVRAAGGDPLNRRGVAQAARAAQAAMGNLAKAAEAEARDDGPRPPGDGGAGATPMRR